MTFEPLGAVIAVLPEPEAENRKVGSIYIPDAAQTFGQRGQVVGIGDDAQQTYPDLKAGDVVVFSKFSGIRITVEATDLVLLKPDEVLGRLKADSTT